MAATIAISQAWSGPAKSAKTNHWHVALGKAFREERLRQRQTQEDLAASSGVHATEISRMESGQRNNTYLSLRKLSTALEIPFSDVIKRAEEIERAEEG